MIRKTLAAAAVSLSIAAGAPAALATGGYDGPFHDYDGRGLPGHYQVPQPQRRWEPARPAAVFRSPGLVQAIASGRLIDALSSARDERIAVARGLYVLGFAVVLDRAWGFMDEASSEAATRIVRRAARAGVSELGISPEAASNMLQAGIGDAQAFGRMTNPNSPAAQRAARQLSMVVSEVVGGGAPSRDPMPQDPSGNVPSRPTPPSVPNGDTGRTTGQSSSACQRFPVLCN